ncbi:MAG TPA: prepilin-type N-terminal cleavage/methylation domain-containing protein [Opitutaceae bacterium]
MISKSRAGFTLIEIMIVVVVIGLLATMAVPTWHQIRETSQNKSITNNLRQLSAAAQQYFLEQGAIAVASSSLVGTEADSYLKTIQTVRGESYPGVLHATDTQISTSGGSPTVSYLP